MGSSPKSPQAGPPNSPQVSRIPYTTDQASVSQALDAIDAGPVLARQDLVVVKPNLVNATPFPVTTRAAFVLALGRYVRSHTAAELIIAEGVADPGLETMEVFQGFGYDAVAAELGARLVDLNTEPCRRLTHPQAEAWGELWLPELVLDGFVVSVPVLKAHSLAGMTGAVKNMMGALPPDRYAGGGSWRKAAFHARMAQSVRDLARYCPPDLSVMDASVGLADHHLGGRKLDPPAGLVLAGFDAVALDAAAGALLGR